MNSKGLLWPRQKDTSLESALGAKKTTRVVSSDVINTDKPPVNIPVSRAFEPVEDVCAAGVIDLVEWVSVGFLHSHSVAERKGVEQ